MNALFACRGERLVQCVKDVISADNVAPAVALQIGIRSAHRDSSSSCGHNTSRARLSKSRSACSASRARRHLIATLDAREFRRIRGILTAIAKVQEWLDQANVSTTHVYDRRNVP
jgi:hypothetical protein